MVRIQYIGHPSKLYGKHLMKILANLKDFGVGRMFVRGIYANEEVPTFYIVKKVKPAMDPDLIWGDVHAQTYFRGVDKGVSVIKSHLPDFRLVHKEDEEKYFAAVIKDPVITILPREMECSPLLKMLIKRDAESRGETFDPNTKLPCSYPAQEMDGKRVAEPGEKPSFEFDKDSCPLEHEELRRGIKFDI
ncbi:uncharacterized protein LOC100898025 [Galendromus occidentalis]|uniref:Uncharacterized protein LOC100898025 n=1 Tax=Galendromus occidentalis TaxID=34638 RepID=A0AAJ6VX14_9ACAR|nr:uncharacterized protein LOC100898025 [Galendromus occidentalis]